LNAHVQDMDRKLQAENDEKKQENSEAKPLFNSWMDLVPLNEFQATQDELFIAFLKWSVKDPSDADDKKKKSKKNPMEDDTNTKSKTFNVTKASRRLDSYFEWMRENMADTLKDRPLTWESIQAAAKIWDIQVTVDDEGRFVWWIDLGVMDQEAIKSMAPLEHVRYVVWFSHLVMLDTHAQDNGAVIVENCGRIGFFKMMTLVPMELSAKLDRLTIGILPVKMKAVHVFGAATWMHVIIGLMRPFMSKKMRERMIIINEKKTDMQAYCDNLVTRKHIPKGFCGLQGEVERDAFYTTWKK
jgi:CRAL/TRIO domain